MRNKYFCTLTTFFVVIVLASIAHAENFPNPFGETEPAPNPFGSWEETESDWETIIKESESMANPQDCPNGFCPPNSLNIEPIPDPTIRVNGSNAFTLSQPGVKSYWATDENGNQVHVTESYTVSNWATNAPVCPRCGGIRNVSSPWVPSRRIYGIRGRFRAARANGRRPMAEIFGAFTGSAARSFARW